MDHETVARRRHGLALVLDVLAAAVAVVVGVSLASALGTPADGAGCRGVAVRRGLAGGYSRRQRQPATASALAHCSAAGAVAGAPGRGVPWRRVVARRSRQRPRTPRPCRVDPAVAVTGLARSIVAGALPRVVPRRPVRVVVVGHPAECAFTAARGRPRFGRRRRSSRWPSACRVSRVRTTSSRRPRPGRYRCHGPRTSW